MEKVKGEIGGFVYLVREREVWRREERGMWLKGRVRDRGGLEKIMGRKGKGVEIEMRELLVEMMWKMKVERV